MNQTGFAFPLPEVESQKLDHLRQELSPTPVMGTAVDYLRTNPWAVVTIAGTVGVLAWLWLKARL